MLLALDTSTQTVGMALFDGAQVIAETTWRTHNHHTIEVAPALNDLFVRSGVRPTELKVVAVATGPGSFTSLRIGLAIAKGIALAQRIPIVGIPSMDFMVAFQPVRELPLAVALQAGRGRLAVGWYAAKGSHWESQGALKILNVEALANQIETPTLVAGELNAAERVVLARKRRLVQLVSPAASLRRPSYLAELAWKRWRAGKVDDVIALAPIYLNAAEGIPA
ncbi:MAG: tRNA (adenosine(37)-N6)-threonylcarbamoyltransferase complex dimerization subunit type 1 TsaB [Chloroflexota bacterium]|jgi:tRNA threonylcarbamoyladenosine biosynthesis protein TsaB